MVAGLIVLVIAGYIYFKYQDRKHTCPKCKAKREEEAKPHCWVCGEEINGQP